MRFKWNNDYKALGFTSAYNQLLINNLYLTIGVNYCFNPSKDHPPKSLLSPS